MIFTYREFDNTTPNGKKWGAKIPIKRQTAKCGQSGGRTEQSRDPPTFPNTEHCISRGPTPRHNPILEARHQETSNLGSALGVFDREGNWNFLNAESQQKSEVGAKVLTVTVSYLRGIAMSC